ncbi:G1 family glutamic endopeptidase [Ornithinicoccus halotolerans]|uniref:G1 family glutamic endopeptidase n=1 Tax=Ornithinicoccus halotolerans TaxID=1748220 RepID=UPI001885E0C2|nr:G1 family glutamic endopeptidase [Ornithinicoccus halotolerans]
MNDQERPSRETIETAPPPREFDPLAASQEELARYAVPQRPDPQTQPGLAALWDQQARRYRTFEHLQAQAPRSVTAEARGTTAQALGLEPTEHCGFTLTSVGAPFTALFVTWTVPNLRHVPSQHGANRFQTFVSLGFLDVHVEMTVDSAQNVAASLTALGMSSVGLPVQPGDVISGSMCLETKPPGRANYVLANETRSQTVNFSFDAGFPPAVTVSAGISRGASDAPFNPLAQFGVIYFDEISAYTTSGARSLTGGQAVTMVDRNGTVLARPFRLNDFGFKAVHAA